jgi:Fic family protein
MKVPMPPPDADSMSKRLMAENRFVEVITSVMPGAMTREYLPWDSLRFKTPPASLSAEEWWFAVRLARRSLQREIGLLRDTDGRPFVYALPDDLLKAVEEVNRDASGHIAISQQVTSPITRDRYIVSSLIEEAITSSQLEGAATSRQVAKEMIRSGRPPKDRSERMILNNYLAMQRISSLRNEPLSPDLICEVHRIVTDGTLDDPAGAGQIQTDDAERIAVWGDGDQLLHRPPPVAQLPERIARLCRFANGDGGEGYMPPVLRAIAIHFMMGYDHYFEDGNGRTARALFYWSMLHQGYWLTEFLTISRILKNAPSKYARSFLYTEQDEGDLTYFYLYQMNVIQRAIADLHTYLARKAEELQDIQSAIKAMPGEYNYRQLAILENAVKNQAAQYTAQSHATSHNTSQETARQDLLALEQKHLLRRFKAGKRFVWTPVEDLAARLRS